MRNYKLVRTTSGNNFEEFLAYVRIFILPPSYHTPQSPLPLTLDNHGGYF